MEFNNFIVKFKDVFNSDFTIKACGREATKSLIYECSKIKPYIDFGNSETGFMNVGNILNLYNSYKV